MAKKTEDTPEGGAEQLVEEFNKLPDELKSWEFGDVKIALKKRGEATVDPLNANRVNADLYFEAIRDGMPAVEINPADYITGSGAVQGQKFLRMNEARLGKAAALIGAKVLDLELAREEVQVKYHMKD